MMCLRSSSATLSMVCAALDQCHVSAVHVEKSRDATDLDIVCVIGQGRQSCPMLCQDLDQPH